MKYETYRLVVTKVFSEELERLEEWIYSIQNNLDCSEDKYWTVEAPGGIPSLEEMAELTDGLDLTVLESDDEDAIEVLAEEIRSRY